MYLGRFRKINKVEKCVEVIGTLREWGMWNNYQEGAEKREGGATCKITTWGGGGG